MVVPSQGRWRPRRSPQNLSAIVRREREWRRPSRPSRGPIELGLGRFQAPERGVIRDGQWQRRKNRDGIPRTAGRGRTPQQSRWVDPGEDGPDLDRPCRRAARRLALRLSRIGQIVWGAGWRCEGRSLAIAPSDEAVSS